MPGFQVKGAERKGCSNQAAALSRTLVDCVLWLLLLQSILCG